MTEQETTALLARLDERTDNIQKLLEAQTDTLTSISKTLGEHNTEIKELQTMGGQNRQMISGLFVWVGAFFAGVVMYVLAHIGFPGSK